MAHTEKATGSGGKARGQETEGLRRAKGGGLGLGPGGNCVCPNCQTKLPHERGNPCSEMKCPKCGNRMVRD